METIGLIGGMSWESSAQYHRIIDQAVRHQLGGTRSARSIMVPLDLDEIERLQHAGDWTALGSAMVEAALERGGADVLLICTNTMHRVADEVTARVALPLLHMLLVRPQDGAVPLFDTNELHALAAVDRVLAR